MCVCRLALAEIILDWYSSHQPCWWALGKFTKFDCGGRSLDCMVFLALIRVHV